MKTTIHRLYADIWREIFEYFNAIELFSSCIHITREADAVLFNEHHRLRLRELVLDGNVETIPEKLSLSQVVSLELHQECCFGNIEQCSELRLLKLIGQPEWVIFLMRKASYTNMKLEQLVVVVPGIGLLYDLLISITSLLSLRRLTIYADELEEKIQAGVLPVVQTNIERFILHSCSFISWNELSHMLPFLSKICFLDITLSQDNKESFCWFTFPKIRYMRLTLLDVSFEWIIMIVKTMPCLAKLKLNGLICADGYVINNKWLNLFDSCSSLDRINVNVSLEYSTNFFCIDMTRTALREINLNLKCIDDDCDYYLSGTNQYRWWNLFGTIKKEHGYSSLTQ